MNTEQNSAVYENLSDDDKSQLDDALEKQAFFTGRLDELQEKLNCLTDEEYNDLEKEENKFIEECYEEKNEANDACELSQIQNNEFEILTEHYPTGVSLLQNEIEKIDDEISSIVKSNMDKK